MNVPTCLPYFLALVAFGAFAVRSARAEPVDPLVENAPTFRCFKGDESHVLRRIELSGTFGPLSLTGGKVVAATATRWIAPSTGRSPINSGAVVCLDEDGKLLWQAVHPRLGKRILDMGQPIRSTPCIEENRAYYVSNRGELVCVDVEGFRDGVNDGPFKSEDPTDTADADYLWKLDMIGELGVFRREASDVGNPASSPLVIGELVYCLTGHGRTGKMEMPYSTNRSDGETRRHPLS